jgi:enamine deaminase RidA (YjgF/YER057c/UK114 family)
MSTSVLKALQPAGWRPAKGYSNGIAGEGRVIFVAGQIGWTAEANIVSDDFVEQAEQALKNIVAVLAEDGAGPEHIARMTWYITDKQAYVQGQRALGLAYQRVIGRHYPAMTLVVVAALLEDRAKVEIEATAIVPAD